MYEERRGIEQRRACLLATASGDLAAVASPAQTRLLRMA